MPPQFVAAIQNDTPVELFTQASPAEHTGEQTGEAALTLYISKKPHKKVIIKNMRLPKISFLIIATIMLVLSTFIVNNPVRIFADEDLQKVEEDIQKTQSKINDLSDKIAKIKGEVGNLSGSLSQVLSTIKQIEAEIADIGNQIGDVTYDINTKSGYLTTQTVLRDRTIRNFYKKGPNNAMTAIVQSNSLLATTDRSEYLKKYFDDSLTVISEINSDIIINRQNKGRLEELRGEVLGEKTKLDQIKANTEQKLALQQQELSAKSSDLGGLNKKLDGLLKKQQEILSKKSGGDFYSSLGDGVQTDDSHASPNYNPGFSPAFAAFSYGAYTHYKGMSQYGAKGRAEDGKSYKDIIKFYYKTDVKDKDIPSKISVDGHGEMDFQYYLYGLAEMPTSWPLDALKAQAIAGRSYAYRYIKSGKSICTSQSCQVFSKSKAESVKNGDYPNWKNAVDDTKNKILENEDTVAYYSSTTGGYIDSVGWDKKGSWPGDAYERRGGSPWFYKGWYTESYSVSSAKCGRDHPWLNEEEMADILNAYVLLKAGKDTDRITPTTTSCWGGNPYSISDLRKKADEIGGGYSKVKSVSVSFSDSGYTSQVKFETDKGSLTADGSLFKSAFNLRAPGYIAIKSKLFDIEKK